MLIKRLGYYKRLIITIISICLLYIIAQRFFFIKHEISISSTLPVVLWWTALLPDYHRIRQCGFYNCVFTVRRQYVQHHHEHISTAIAFYGSDINITDLPLPRLSNHIWALMHEESPKNAPIIQSEKFLQYFNLTSTFSRYSNLPLTTQYIDNIEKLTTKRYLVPIGEKTKLRRKENLAPIAFIQSICDTMSGRDEYIKELMNYIEIDSYGKCLNNRKLPKSLSENYLRTIESEEFYRFLARYKFIIAYENGVCNDYITEKFWRPIFIGSVPIYFGSPTIKDWMPHPNSAILINDFNSPKELAEFIKFLDENDYEYNKYLDHKYSQIDPVTNILLKNSILQRGFKGSTLFEDFECFLCENLYNKVQSIADKKHYDCDYALQYPKMSTRIKDNNWEHILKYDRCQAEVLNNFLLKNRNYTKEEFNDAVTKSIENNICIF